MVVMMPRRMRSKRIELWIADSLRYCWLGHRVYIKPRGVDQECRKSYEPILTSICVPSDQVLLVLQNVTMAHHPVTVVDLIWTVPKPPIHYDHTNI